MEVHAHTHTERKKWTHYFWEFLMLFLAVTLGFFVENQREHYVERQREKQYIRSLVQDLKLDTASLNNIIKLRRVRSEKNDSLILLFNRPDAAAYGSDIYFFARFLTRGLGMRFYSNDGTMQQLKNSGGLRLVRQHAVADSIIRYDVATRTMLTQTQVEQTLIEEFRTEASKIFDGRVFNTMVDPESNISRPAGNPVFKQDKENLFPFYTRLHYINSINIINRNVNIDLLHKAENLLQTLIKKYHIE